MLFLQNLPTKHWKNDDISLLLAEAYSLKYMFADAPKHLGQQKKRWSLKVFFLLTGKWPQVRPTVLDKVMSRQWLTQ